MTTIRTDADVLEDIQQTLEAFKEDRTPPPSHWGCGYCGTVFNRVEVPVIQHIETCRG